MKKSTKTWLFLGVAIAVLYFFWTPIQSAFSSIMAKFQGGSTASGTGGTTSSSDSGNGGD